MLFQNLHVWLDETPRSGAENMAVDEWLIQSVGEVPFLRIYSWDGDWVSLGYFQSLVDAKELFGKVSQLVRRWTGGGIVDHREDLTYTLAIPRSEELVSRRGNESYGAIHREIARCLGEGGIGCQLTQEDSQNDSAACFERPVAWDLLGDDGAKLAGAGQRRTRRGILHQGSVVATEGALDGLGSFLSETCESHEPNETMIWAQMAVKYASKGWLARVP